MILITLQNFSSTKEKQLKRKKKKSKILVNFCSPQKSHLPALHAKKQACPVGFSGVPSRPHPHPSKKIPKFTEPKATFSLFYCGF